MDERSVTTKPRGRPKRSPDQRKSYAVSFRTDARLKDLLQHAAFSSGRSVATEVHARLNRQFTEEEVLGGHEARQMMLLMIGVFRHAGQIGAVKLGHTEWEFREWIKDPEAYLAAMKGVVLALWDAFPDPEVSFETKSAWVYDVYRSLASREANKDPEGFARVKAVEAAAARQKQ
jgi:hypothetical protein